MEGASAQPPSPAPIGTGSKQTSSRPLKKRLARFIIGFVLLVAAAVAGLFVLGWYGEWSGTKRVERLAQELKRFEEEQYQRMLADTYGGKTPQETLAMYIEAVEKGDYELASKYFIEENREKELKSFEGAPIKNIENVMNLLRQTMRATGQYSTDGKRFYIDEPIYVQMVLYPNGIWKIIEI